MIKILPVILYLMPIIGYAMSFPDSQFTKSGKEGMNPVLVVSNINSVPEVLNINNTINQKSYDVIQLKDIDNKPVTLSDVSKNNSILLISFWATWCKPCMEELNAINEKLENWKSDSDFQFIAISIDDARSGSKIKSIANGKGWNFTILKDANQDLKRYFNISIIPASLIIKNGEVKFKHSGYSPGNEDDLFNEIRKLNE